MRRAGRLLGTVMFIAAVNSVAPAAAQVLPTRPAPTVSPTSAVPTKTTKLPANTAATQPQSITTRRVVATTLLRTTSTAREDTTVPTEAPLQVHEDSSGGGGISPIFTALSIGGFLAVVGMVGRQWYRTRPDLPRR